MRIMAAHELLPLNIKYAAAINDNAPRARIILSRRVLKSPLGRLKPLPMIVSAAPAANGYAAQWISIMHNIVDAITVK